MQSVCPNCKTGIEHEDFLFEVVCTNCKTRFNPFMQQMDAPATEIPGLTPAGGEPAQMSTIGSPDNFAESNQVFQELQTFGETLQDPADNKPAAASPAPSAAKSASPSASGGQMMVAVASECAMTTGDTLQGHTIEAYLEPVSALADLDGGSDNPMKGAYDAAATAAKNQGGNGMIGLRWQLNGNKVLVSGVAVRVVKS